MIWVNELKYQRAYRHERYFAVRQCLCDSSPSIKTGSPDIDKNPFYLVFFFLRDVRVGM